VGAGAHGGGVRQRSLPRFRTLLPREINAFKGDTFHSFLPPVKPTSQRLRRRAHGRIKTGCFVENLKDFILLQNFLVRLGSKLIISNFYKINDIQHNVH